MHKMIRKDRVKGGTGDGLCIPSKYRALEHLVKDEFGQMQAMGSGVIGVYVGKTGCSQSSHDFKNQKKKQLNLVGSREPMVICGHKWL